MVDAVRRHVRPSSSASGGRHRRGGTSSSAASRRRVLASTRSPSASTAASTAGRAARRLVAERRGGGRRRGAIGVRRRRRRSFHRRRARSPAQSGPQPVSPRHDPGGLSLAADAVAAARQLHVPQAPEPHRRLPGSAASHGARVAAADDPVGHRPARLRDAAADQANPAALAEYGRRWLRLVGEEPAARLGVPVEFATSSQRQGRALRRVGADRPAAQVDDAHLFNARRSTRRRWRWRRSRRPPRLARFIGPPCVVRNGLVSPRCTEGSKFCGVPVWRDFPNAVRPL